MNARAVTVFASLVLAVPLSVAPAPAQEEPIKRTILQRGELSGMAGHEGVLYKVELAPGAAAPKHTHPGDEFIYVERGSVLIQPEGKEPVTLKAGDSVHMPMGTVHTARNADAAAPAVIIAYLVTQAGHPLATAVE